MNENGDVQKRLSVEKWNGEWGEKTREKIYIKTLEVDQVYSHHVLSLPSSVSEKNEFTVQSISNFLLISLFTLHIIFFCERFIMFFFLFGFSLSRKWEEERGENVEILIHFN